MDESQQAILKATVEKYGVLNEPIVRPVTGDTYELIAGLSRLTELKSQGATEVDVKIIEASEKDAMMMHLAENLARGHTDPMSEARVLDAFMNSGATLEEAAKITGHTPEWVRFRLGLLKLPEIYSRALEEGRLKLGHIEAATALPTPEEVDHALGLALETKWTVPVTVNYVKQRLAEHEAARMKEEIGPPPELPSREQAEDLVRYFTCAGCNRSVDRSLARTPPLCEECLALIRYVTSQLGEPKQAMQYIFRAVDNYQKYLEYQRQKETFEKMEEAKRRTPSTTTMTTTTTAKPEE
jgi:ParB/RepB/Spo0J family partition protein